MRPQDTLLGYSVVWQVGSRKCPDSENSKRKPDRSSWPCFRNKWCHFHHRVLVKAVKTSAHVQRREHGHCQQK
jgi:hypothetical protein